MNHRAGQAAAKHVAPATGHLPIGDGPDETTHLAPDSALNDQIWTAGVFHRHHAYTTQNGGSGAQESHPRWVTAVTLSEGL